MILDARIPQKIVAKGDSKENWINKSCDFYLWYATIEGFIAIDSIDKTEGGLLLKSLYELLTFKVEKETEDKLNTLVIKEMSIQTMSTFVNRQIVAKAKGKQIGSPINQLRSEVFLAKRK